MRAALVALALAASVSVLASSPKKQTPRPKCDTKVFGDKCVAKLEVTLGSKGFPK